MSDFYRLSLLPQYIFNSLADMKQAAIQDGQDVIDFGMGNPDQPTPQHIVEALVAAARKPENHRYSLSKGIDALRAAISQWYQTKYNVAVDPQREAIVTIGSKEGIAHLALAMISPGDIALVPSPAYPIHTYAFTIAGANVKRIPLTQDLQNFLNQIIAVYEGSGPKPKILVLNFPSNPTAACVELDFFEEVVKVVKRYGGYIMHDLAYADLVFDGYVAPSILQVRGAKDVAVECYTLSKTYNMPGWRVGFMCGNEKLVAALTKMKSYLDYGMFAPIQEAAITALTGDQDCVSQIRDTYQQRRDVFCAGLQASGWSCNIPKASMFVWARIPEQYQTLGSFEFAKQLLLQANIAVSPGIGFGQEGDSHVRFSLIQNEQRIGEAVLRIQKMLADEQLIVT